MAYTSHYPPGVAVDPSIVQYFQDLYSISDNPDAHDEYADLFTDDATLTLGSTVCRGRQEILNIRRGMWTAIASRKHNIIQIFPFGSAAREFMLHGTVALGFKDGKGQANVDWAARAQLTQQDGRWKMSYYQVYLDTGGNLYDKK